MLTCFYIFAMMMTVETKNYDVRCMELESEQIQTNSI